MIREFEVGKSVSHLQLRVHRIIHVCRSFRDKRHQVDGKGLIQPGASREEHTPGHPRGLPPSNATRTSTQPPSKEVHACSRLGRVMVDSVRGTDRITVLR